MLYTLTVVLVAVRLGRGPAILAAILNVLAFDFFFVPPRYGFIPTDIQYLLTFAVMLAVGVLIGQLAGNLRFQARVASHREKRARTLYEFARDLAELQTTGAGDRDHRGVPRAQLPRARGAPGARCDRHARLAHGPRHDQSASTAPRPSGPTSRRSRRAPGTDTLATNEYLFLPLKSPTRTRGVLAVRPERTRDLFIPEQRHQFEIFATLVATALERVHYVDVARDALLMARMPERRPGARARAPPVADLVEAALRRLGALMRKHPVTVEVSRELPLGARGPGAARSACS